LVRKPAPEPPFWTDGQRGELVRLRRIEAGDEHPTVGLGSVAYRRLVTMIRSWSPSNVNSMPPAEFGAPNACADDVVERLRVARAEVEGDLRRRRPGSRRGSSSTSP
jgi:hypothetical protein